MSDKKEDGDNAKTTSTNELESSCGLGPCQPKALECCRQVLSFTLFYGLASLVTSTLSVYIVSQVTALEKQFSLTSTTTGIILSCNDIGFLCTVIFFSHFGKYGHIPRILSVATFLFGISGILASLCHFLDPAHLPKLSAETMKNNSSTAKTFTAPLCLASDYDQCHSEDSEQGSTGTNWPLWLLGFGMVLQGVGKAPRTSLATTYIDNNNAVKTKTGFYLGISMTMTLFGPALAIAIGGVFRRIPVDLQETVLTPTHPKWIGAWWLGFLVFGVVGIFVSLPLLFFPKHIIKSDVEQEKNKKSSAADSIKDLPRSIIRILKSPVYTLSLAGLLGLLFVVAGTQSFNSKYIEKQFMMPGYKTNILYGIQTIVSASTGTFVGGLVTSRLKLTRIGNLKMVLGAVFISLCLNSCDFFLGCETPHIKGFQDNKGLLTFHDGEKLCTCDSMNFFPVCGDGSDTYFSPCFAGCTNQTQSMYGGCTKLTSGQATAGLCETDCPYLYYYLGVDMVQKLVGTMSILPLYMTIIRSVEERDKTIALGLQSFLGSLLGFLPAPILFGYVIDSSCLIWQYTCGVKGSCGQYDLRDLRFKLKASECGGKVVCLLFFLTAFCMLKMKGDDENTTIDVKAKQTETSKL